MECYFIRCTDWRRCILEITLRLTPEVAHFYTRIAGNTGLSLEQVLSDALFKLAGELSLEALRAAQSPGE